MIRSYFKKAVAMFISFVMMITVFLTFPISYFTASAICCRKDGFDKLKYTLTGDMAKDVATIAKSQKGRTCDQFGYSGVDYGLWCDEFVADCLENAGADSSIVGHGGTVANFETIMRKKGAKPVSSPQTGDLVFFTSSHVEIVTKVSNGVVYSAGGNNGSYPGMCQGEHVVSNARLYLRPKYPNKKYTLSIHYNANGGTVASDSNYYIGSNNDLYRKSDNKLMGPTWEDGYKDPDGLVNASTLKLTKSGYTFLGWSLQKSGGKIYDQNDSTVSANDLYPNITKQNGTVMLYAQWAKDTVTMPTISTTTTALTTTTTTTALTTTTSSTTTTIPTTNPKPIEDFDLTMRNGERYTIEIEQSNLIFKSNNTDVAVVSKSGVITAIGEGKATITVIFSNGNISQVFLNVISAEHITGDVNFDEKFDVADVILLQKWFLAVPNTHLVDWQAADLCEDGRLNVFDLCLMKRLLVENR